MSEKKLRIVPLGGLGEVGKNMTIFEYDNDIMIVDTGLMFPENDMLGIDFIIPDFSYLDDKWDMVRGIVITHGHEDHTGAIGYVLRNRPDIPVYATPLTCGLLEVKLRRAKLQNQVKLTTVEAGEMVSIGPFEVEFFHVCHSIPDCVGLGISTPVGLLVHTGDFKIDHTPVDGWPTDFAKLAEFGGRGVLALLSDSTNAGIPGWTPSETVIDRAFDEVFAEAKGRILVASFASLISRIQQVLNVAGRYGRKVALVGTSMVENSKMARKLGYLEDPNNVIISLDQAKSMPDSKVVLMVTGSQGEPGAILGRLAAGRNRRFDLQAGDTVIVSANPIPGNEETVARTINRLIQRGANVIYDPLKQVHVSGHASSEEQKLMIGLIRPKFFVPVHGELRMLVAHSELAKEMGIPQENILVVENGTPIELTENKITAGERIPGGYVYVDGSGVGDIGPRVLRDRDRLAKDGLVIVNMRVDEETGKLLDPPEIISKGFVYVRESSELFELAADKVAAVAAQNSNSKLARSVENKLSEFFYSEIKRRPMIFVLVNEM